MMPRPRTVEIVEVGPRDGLQSGAEVLSTPAKVEFIRRILDTGVRRIEAVSFVHPARVPQMADAEAVMAQVPRIPGAGFIGLVLNDRGLDRALAAGVDEIGGVVLASETFSERNQGAGIEACIDRWSAIAQKAHASGLRTSVTISAAFGCPFEGEVPEERVMSIAAEVLEAEPYELAIADTVGVGVPAQVISLLPKLRALAPKVRLRAHFHNTRNTGMANAQAAVESGVDTLDSSIGGVGGCPFAPSATGNIATEDLLYMLQRQGIETGVSVDKAIAVSHWLAEVMQRSLPAMLPRAGPFPSRATLDGTSQEKERS